MKYDVYTDGSCINNESNPSGGWAFVICEGDNIVNSEFGKLREGKQDPLRAEIEAFYQAVLTCSKMDKQSKFSFYTDSKMLYRAVVGEVSRNSNKDMWAQIEAVAPCLAGRVEVKHVSAHSGITMNEYVDRQAKQGANAIFMAPVAV